jgi:hypothetical protein
MEVAVEPWPELTYQGACVPQQRDSAQDKRLKEPLEVRRLPE